MNPTRFSNVRFAAQEGVTDAAYSVRLIPRCLANSNPPITQNGNAARPDQLKLRRLVSLRWSFHL
jgi:hypothetical protein